MANVVTGSGNLVAGSATIGLASSAHVFLGAARDFLTGLEWLMQGPPQLWRSCAFEGAQALECVLKSFLSKKGLSDDELRNDYGHRLEKLWAEAARRGLDIPQQPPNWCVLLNAVHTSPYPLRYPSRYNGVVLPARAEAAAELKMLIAKVEAA